MPDIINQFKQFITNLETFNFPPLPKDAPTSPLISEQIQDQLILTNLLVLLKKIVKDKVDDLDVTHADLITVQNHCKPCINKQLQQLVTENIKAFCKIALEERQALFKEIYSFVYNCKIVTNMSLIDVSKVAPEVIVASKRIFKTDNLMPYIASTELDVLLGLLNKLVQFADNVLFTHVTLLQKKYESTIVTIARSREALSPTRFEAGDSATTDYFDKRFKLLRDKYGRDPFTASSAPNSPTAKQVPSPKGPSSLPNSPHKPEDLIADSDDDHDVKDNSSSADKSERRMRSSSHNVPPLPLRFSKAPAQKPIPRGAHSTGSLPVAFRKLNLAPSGEQDDELETEVVPQGLDAPRAKPGAK